MRIIIDLSGSGKTYLAKELTIKLKAKHLNADELFEIPKKYDLRILEKNSNYWANISYDKIGKNEL